MRKHKLLLLLLAVALIGTSSACTSKKRRRGGGGGGGGNISEAIWKQGFTGCIRPGGDGRATADQIDDLDPITSNGKTLFAVFTTHTVTYDPDYPVEEYEMDIDYEFSVEVNGSEGKWEDYVEASVVNGNKKIYFFKNFPAVGTEAASYPLLHVKANGSIGNAKETFNYTLRFNPYNVSFYKMDLSEIYQTGSECLPWMSKDFIPGSASGPIAGAYGPDHTQHEEWYFNEEKNSVSAYIETYGYITYVSPDLNNGILECGNQAIQLYQLKEYMGWVHSAEAVMNTPVLVRGSLSGGFGNIQVSYIKEVFPIPSGYDHSATQPATPVALSESLVSNAKWWENPVFNTVVKASDVTYQGNLHKITNKQGGEPTVVDPEISGDQADFASARYEFDVKIGNTTLTVQTDYHMLERYPELAETLNNIVKKSKGSTVKIGGTIRWLNDRAKVGGNDYSTRNEGKWEIVPYLPEHASAN